MCLRKKREAVMPIIALPAHFDGKRICLDEPYELKTDTKLIVTVLPRHEPDEEKLSWTLISRRKLQDAYGKDEPDYPASLVKELNSDYEAG